MVPSRRMRYGGGGFAPPFRKCVNPIRERTNRRSNKETYIRIRLFHPMQVVKAIILWMMKFVCVKVSVYIAAPAALPASTLSDRLINNCARQRLVAASSRRTEEKVASRRGSGRHCRKASRARLLSLSLTHR